MQLFLSILVYIGIFLGISLLVSLPPYISRLVINIKYKRRLKKITPNLILFDIETKKQQYLQQLDNYKQQQQNLISFYKFKFDKNENTVDYIIKKMQREREVEKYNKKRKTRKLY